MTDIPAVVTAIANDYLERVKLQLRMVPASEQDEFLKEIQSHIYEAYRQAPGDDEAGRILAVLRKLGEPAEVVSDWLPASMVRSGAGRMQPLKVVGGVFIALFGIPLGFGGVAVLAGVLLSLVGAAIAYYAVVGSVFLTSALFMVMGLTRIYQPAFWDKLVALGIIRMDGPLGPVLDQLSQPAQGFVFIMLAIVFAAAGVGMLRLGRYLVRGLRFLFSLAFTWLGRVAQGARRKLGRVARGEFQASHASPAR